MNISGRTIYLQISILLIILFLKGQGQTCFQTLTYAYPQILGSSLAPTRILCSDINSTKNKIIIGGFSQASDVISTS